MDETRCCLRCAGTGVPVVYGMPDEELEQAAARGDVIIGGCVIPDDVATMTCPDCGELWSATEPIPDALPQGYADVRTNPDW